MKPSTLFLLITTLILSACRGGLSGSVEAGVTTTITIEPSTPELLAFNIVDSYGVNTEYNGNIPLSVSPFVDSGFFEIFWDVDNFDFGFQEDYQVNFYINDAPTVRNSILISANYCGPFDRCNDFGYQQCFYNDNLSVTCELPNSGAIDATVDISDLFISIPEPLYFVLEICDDLGIYCETDAWPVLME